MEFMTSPGRSARRSRRALTDEERTLWSNATRSIARLNPAERETAGPDDDAVATPEVAPKGRLAPPSGARPSATPALPALAPFDRRLKQRVARGHLPIDARIDLHGLTQSEAHDALVRFLRLARGKGARMVLVITGKGSPQAPDADGERGVLRRWVPYWLRSPQLRDVVVGFDPAHRGHGGEGALYVRIRRARSS